MDTYKKLVKKQKLTKIASYVCPFFPFVAVLAVMSINTPFSQESKPSWAVCLVLAFAAIVPIAKLMAKLVTHSTKELLNYCAQSVVKPMLSKEFSDIEVFAGKKIEEGDVSVLFSRQHSSAGQYTDYNDYFGSWLIKGTYEGQPFVFSNLTTTKNGSRSTKFKVFFGIFVTVSIDQSFPFDGANFEKRLNWVNPYENNFMNKRGGCYYRACSNGKLYIALDCRRNLFAPQTMDLKTYENNSAEDLLLLKRVLDAARSDSRE